MKAIHNQIGPIVFHEPDFDEVGGRTFRRVVVPKKTVREIVNLTLALATKDTTP